MGDAQTQLKLRRRAAALLARREHSRSELFAKLKKRPRAGSEDRVMAELTTGSGLQPDSGQENPADRDRLINGVLDELEAERLLSDERFATSFVRSRAAKGYGPIQIRLGLCERGVADALVSTVLERCELDWHALASKVRTRRFGLQCPQTLKARARQIRFLEYRGFSAEAIRESFRDRAED